MFKSDNFTILDWEVFFILAWIPMVNIVFVVLFAIKKGLFYTIKKAFIVFIMGIVITLIAIALLGFNI